MAATTTITMTITVRLVSVIIRIPTMHKDQGRDESRRGDGVKHFSGAVLLASGATPKRVALWQLLSQKDTFEINVN